MDESTCLESMRPGNGTVGSNPTLSAMSWRGTCLIYCGAAVARQSEAVGSDDAGDDGFAQTERAFDDPFVRARQRILGEQDARALCRHQRLEDDGHAGLGGNTEPLAIGQRRRRSYRGVDALQSQKQRLGRAHVEHARMLAGKTRLGAVLAQRRRAHGARPQRGVRPSQAFASRTVAVHGLFYECRSNRPTSRDGQARAQCASQLERFAPVVCAVDDV